VTDLLLDRAAAGRRLTPEEVRGWAESQRMFVSSVIEDYREPRQAAVRATEAVGAQPVYFERFGGRDADPNQAYLDEVASCSVYIGLLGTRYGRLLPSRFSATHEEYRYAEQHGLRLAVWAQRNVEREGHQQSFLEEVQAFHTTGEFLDEAELERDVRTRLEAIAAEDLSPWVKLGSLIFRASEIRIARESATIVATTRRIGPTRGPRARQRLFAADRRRRVCRAGGDRDDAVDLVGDDGQVPAHRHRPRHARVGRWRATLVPYRTSRG